MGVAATLDDSASLDPGGAAIERFCPDEPAPRVLEIREANPEINEEHHDYARDLLMKEVRVANTTILLVPDVVLDFSDASPIDPENESWFLKFGPCVMLASASAFEPDIIDPGPSGAITQGIASDKGLSTIVLPDSLVPQSTSAARPNLCDNILDGRQQSARTPRSLGALLKFGPHRDGTMNFLLIDCRAGDPPNDNVRISGFRLYGPSFGQQSVDDNGIKIYRCLNIEISNMEIAGWGGQAILVEDDPEQGMGQEQPNNLPGKRIGRPEQIRIFNNYIHHNQHPRMTFSNHSAGYGVNVGHGAWAQVYENVFDFNRHAIAASGDTGGYDAFRNLVLKGGGLHYGALGIHTHQFDIHGSGNNGFGGRAGTQFSFSENSFQYLAGAAIEIRGRPDLLFRRRLIDHLLRDLLAAIGHGLDGQETACVPVDNRHDVDFVFFLPRKVKSSSCSATSTGWSGILCEYQFIVSVPGEQFAAVAHPGTQLLQYIHRVAV